MSEKREKILFVITKSNWGGAQRYVFDLATTLKDRFDVSVALGGDGRLKTLLEAQGIPVVLLPHLKRDISLKAEFRSFLDTYRVIRSVRPDILHLNSSKAGGLGALAGRLAFVKRIVFTAHAWAWNEERPLLSRLAISALHFATVMLAHRTICVSHAVYDQMARFPLTRRRMRVVHLGIQPAPQVSRSQARAYLTERVPALQEAAEKTWIGIVGELHPVKGHRYALAAMATLSKTHPDLRMVIIGEGGIRESLERMRDEMHLGGIVYFTGHVDDAASLMAAFDLALVPSLSEAFGYVVVESGAAEVAVVASSVGGIPEIIEKDSGILVPPADIPALTDAIETMLQNTDLRHTSARTLKARVLAYFTRERMTEETVSTYELMG